MILKKSYNSFLDNILTTLHIINKKTKRYLFKPKKTKNKLIWLYKEQLNEIERLILHMNVPGYL